MPQVPLYRGPQLAETAAPTPYQRAPDSTSGVNNLVANLNSVSDVADRVITREAQDEAFRLETQVRSDWLQQRAVLREQYKGDNADQYDKAAQEWWTQAASRYGAEASPLARRLASRSLAQARLSAQDDTINYVTGEKTRARKVNYETAQGAEIAAAGETMTPANALTTARVTTESLRQRARAYAIGEGFGTEVGDSLAQETIARFHLNTVAMLADKDAGAAKTYLNEFGGEMDQGQRTRVQAVVDAAWSDQEGQRIAASLATMPYAQRLKEASKIADPDLQENVLRHTDLMYAREERIRNDQKRAATDAAWGAVVRGEAPSTATLAALGQEGAQIQQFMRARAKQEIEGKVVRTDPTVLAALYDEARTDPAKFKERQLAPLALTLAEDDLTRLAAMQREMRKPGTPAAEVATPLQQIGQYTVGMDDEEKVRLSRAALDEFDAIRTRTGKPPDYTTRQQILDRLTFDNGNWMGESRLMDVPANERTAWVNAQVPPKDRAEILKALDARGIPPTPAAVYDMWIKGQDE